ncbi:MAG TPA: YggS family pyridoxal phosphate-dependent enzyme [Chitinophagaceae bacterium]|nr:YggS family pyridoxal phosphate-dependent enzyme [Chitinophagaceae bacterium]
MSTQPSEGNLARLRRELPREIRIVAVSKTQPTERILELYQQGQRDFGENYVQELATKKTLLPADIRWHFIGHLQSNKVRTIAPFVAFIHSVDSLKLLGEIHRQASRSARVIDCLLQIHISQEDTKFGLDEPSLFELAKAVCSHPGDYSNARLVGLMGMSTLTADQALIREEFRKLKQLLEELQLQYFGDAPWFRELSMGMSADYPIAVEEGATLLRIGSLLFGPRN